MKTGQEIFRNIFLFLLKILAQLTLWRYRPRIIGVTGSVGKSSSKEAIFAVLKNKYRVRRNIKNYNNEIGVPLTIFGQETGGKSIWAWIRIFLVSFFQIIYTRDYPEILILEMGADRIGDIGYLTGFVPCWAGVVTAIGEIPVHVEFFQSAGQVVKEKSKLIQCLDKNGWAVLNFDDERVAGMAARTSAQVFSYGFSEKADLRASNIEEHFENFNEAGLSFKVDYGGSNVPIRLQNILAPHQVIDILAGVAVGIISKMNLVDIARELRDYRPPVGRLNLLRGIKKSWLIDENAGQKNCRLGRYAGVGRFYGRSTPASWRQGCQDG
jgi:UDP-N-acetylmuramoyl-tripeptide--D-alanyl-D-alanine ligase